jgi:hypothetical protein
MEVAPLTPGNEETKQWKHHQQQRQQQRQVKHNASGWSNSMALFSSFAESKQVPKRRWHVCISGREIPLQLQVGQTATRLSNPIAAMVACWRGRAGTKRYGLPDFIADEESCKKELRFWHSKSRWHRHLYQIGANFEPWTVTCGLTKWCSNWHATVT